MRPSKNSRQQDPAFSAATEGKIAIMDVVVLKAGADPNAKDESAA